MSRPKSSALDSGVGSKPGTAQRLLDDETSTAADILGKLPLSPRALETYMEAANPAKRIALSRQASRQRASESREARLATMSEDELETQHILGRIRSFISGAEEEMDIRKSSVVSPTYN